MRRGICAGLVVGGTTALLFGVVHKALGEDANQWLAWTRTWLLLAGIPAAVGAARLSGRGDQPAIGAHWRARKGLRGALAAGAIAALIGGFISRSAFGLPLSVLGVAFAVTGGAAFGMERIPGGMTEAVSPAAVLARDRRAALLLTLITGAAAAVLTGVAVTSWDASYQSPDTGHLIALEDGLSMAAGTGVTVTVGLAVAGLGLAWPQWLIARSWLALRGHLPFRLMAFLDDAHERGVLRQAGPFYQFRHIELQHHLGASSRLGESALRGPPGDQAKTAQAKVHSPEAARAGQIASRKEKDRNLQNPRLVQALSRELKPRTFKLKGRHSG